jgi:hypothetical protein
MIARNVTKGQLQDAAKEINVELYDVRPEGRGFRFRILPTFKLDCDCRFSEGKLKHHQRDCDSRKYKYQRASATNLERRVHAVCWHGFRDFFRVLFSYEPEAKIKTACARYYGIKEFEENFPETGFRNIGSMLAPTQYREACWCSDHGDDFDNYQGWNNG